MPITKLNALLIFLSSIFVVKKFKVSRFCDVSLPLIDICDTIIDFIVRL